MPRNNNPIPDTHSKKDKQRLTKVNFDQPLKKKRRQLRRLQKAKVAFPRPVSFLRPAVHPPTIRYNSKLRLGRGFTLAELKAVGIQAHFARTIGISVDKRRRNHCEESLSQNIQRLKEYKAKLVIFKKPKVKVTEKKKKRSREGKEEQPKEKRPKKEKKPKEKKPKKEKKPGEEAKPKKEKKPKQEKKPGEEKPKEKKPKQEKKPGEDKPKEKKPKEKKPGEDKPKEKKAKQEKKPGEDKPKEAKKPGEDKPKEAKKPKEPKKPGEDKPKEAKEPKKSGEEKPKAKKPAQKKIKVAKKPTAKKPTAKKVKKVEKKAEAGEPGKAKLPKKKVAKKRKVVRIVTTGVRDDLVKLGQITGDVLPLQAPKVKIQGVKISEVEDVRAYYALRAARSLARTVGIRKKAAEKKAAEAAIK